MGNQHYYKNHLHVKSVLTTKYGFVYSGTGDNSEECFSKNSPTPEQVYIHPMFCSHHKSGVKVRFPSDRTSEEDQEKAFNELIVHLDRVTVKVKVDPLSVPTVGLKQRPSFSEAMRFNNVLLPLFREGFAKGDFTKQAAMEFLGLTIEEFDKLEAQLT